MILTQLSRALLQLEQNPSGRWLISCMVCALGDWSTRWETGKPQFPD